MPAGPQHRVFELIDHATGLEARHVLVAALMDRLEPVEQGRRQLFARTVAFRLQHEASAPRGWHKQEKNVTGAGVDQPHPRPNADRHAPVIGRFDLGGDDQHVAVVDDEMAALLGGARKPAHHWQGLADEALHRGACVRQLEHLQAQLIAVGARCART